MDGFDIASITVGRGSVKDLRHKRSICNDFNTLLRYCAATTVIAEMHYVIR